MPHLKFAELGCTSTSRAVSAGIRLLGGTVCKSVVPYHIKLIIPRFVGISNDLIF